MGSTAHMNLGLSTRLLLITLAISALHPPKLAPRPQHWEHTHILMPEKLCSLQRLLLCCADGIHEGHQPLLWHINNVVPVVDDAVPPSRPKDSPCCGEAA